MKRYGKAKSRYVRTLARLTPNDRSEVEKFEAFLGDVGAGLTGEQLIERHGREYLGLEPQPEQARPQ